jgi:hypothetical protein
MRIRVVVHQLAPICRRIGSFAFAARRGVNVVHVPARIGRRRLGVGTYELVGRTHAGRKVFEAHALVVRRMVRGRLLRTLLVRRGSVVDRCSTEISTTVSFIDGPPTEEVAAAHHGFGIGTPPPQASRRRSRPITGALGLGGGPGTLRWLVIVLAVMSIGLLSVAAVPDRLLPEGPVAAALAQKRIELAVAGIWLLALLAAVIALR